MQVQQLGAVEEHFSLELSDTQLDSIVGGQSNQKTSFFQTLTQYFLDAVAIVLDIVGHILELIVKVG